MSNNLEVRIDGFLIRAHPWHLACEFSHWIHEIQRRVESS